MTLTTALHLHRGGSPKGPAGTGKTETVKDLGKALGMYVIVVNCSEGLDYKSMGRMYSGLAQVGERRASNDEEEDDDSGQLNCVQICTYSILCSLHRRERGAASMSSTASTSRCCRWWPSRSCPSCLPSQPHNPSSISMDSSSVWSVHAASSSP